MGGIDGRDDAKLCVGCVSAPLAATWKRGRPVALISCAMLCVSLFTPEARLFTPEVRFRQIGALNPRIALRLFTPDSKSA